MKLTRTITIVILCFLCATTQAQDSWIKNIEWEILKLGYSNTSDIADIKSGYFAGSELRYKISNRVSIGIATDFSLFLSNIEGDDFNFDYAAIGSLTSDYYTSWNNNKRAFFGFTLGTLSTNTIYFVDGEEVSRLEEAEDLVFGPRIGFEFKKMRVSLQQNISTSKEIPNVLTLHVGFTLWQNR